MPQRRLTFALLGLALTLLLLWLALRVLAPGGWTPWEALLLACFAGTAPWTALCAANALVGGVILLRSPHPPAAVLPALRRTRPGAGRLHTAIAVCIRNEDMAAVLPPLARLLDGLRQAGAAGRFTLWFLSDTEDPALVGGRAGRHRRLQRPLPRHPLPPPRRQYRLQGRQRDGLPRPPCRRRGADALPRRR